MDIEAPPLQSVLIAAAQKGGPAHSDLRHVCRRWWSVARLWWRCPAERRTAWGYTAASIGLSLPYVALLLWISYVQNVRRRVDGAPGLRNWRAVVCPLVPPKCPDLMAVLSCPCTTAGHAQLAVRETARCEACLG